VRTGHRVQGTGCRAQGTGHGVRGPGCRTGKRFFFWGGLLGLALIPKGQFGNVARTVLRLKTLASKPGADTGWLGAFDLSPQRQGTGLRAQGAGL